MIYHVEYKFKRHNKEHVHECQIKSEPSRIVGSILYYFRMNKIKIISTSSNLKVQNVNIKNVNVDGYGIITCQNDGKIEVIEKNKFGYNVEKTLKMDIQIICKPVGIFLQTEHGFLNKILLPFSGTDLHLAYQFKDYIELWEWILDNKEKLQWKEDLHRYKVSIYESLYIEPNTIRKSRNLDAKDKCIGFLNELNSNSDYGSYESLTEEEADIKQECIDRLYNLGIGQFYIDMFEQGQILSTFDLFGKKDYSLTKEEIELVSNDEREVYYVIRDYFFNSYSVGVSKNFSDWQKEREQIEQGKLTVFDGTKYFEINYKKIKDTLRIWEKDDDQI